MRAFPTAAALALLLTGCLGGAPDEAREPRTGGAWAPDPCDPDPGARRSGNAPPLDALAGTPAEIVAAAAAALGVALPPKNEARSDGRDLDEWGDRETGYVFAYDYPRPGEPFRVRYSAAYLWPGESRDGAEPFLRGFLDGLGAPSDVVVDLSDWRRGGFEQRFRGSVLASGGYDVSDGRHEYGWWSTLAFGPLADLDAPRVAVGGDEATETAKAFMRCVMDRQGNTEAAGFPFDHVVGGGERFVVRNESVAREVKLAYAVPWDGHCEFLVRTVAVDAETGAVVGRGFVGCD